MRFKMSGGWWLFFCGAIYLIAEGIAIFGYHHVGNEDLTTVYIQLVWLFITSLPLWVKPLARFCNMRD